MGMSKLRELMALVEADGAVPDRTRQALGALFNQCRALDGCIEAFEAEIVAHAKGNDTARRLATIAGVGPITSLLIAATVADIGVFQSARHFAAWLGLVPRQHSTGGKTCLGRITKMGNRERLLSGSGVVRSERASLRAATIVGRAAVPTPVRSSAAAA